MNLRILPGAALEDARAIEDIVDKINNALEELNSVINKTIPEEVRLAWALMIKDEWDSYYNQSVPEKLAEMKVSAANLKIAVEKTLAFSNEQN